MQATALASVAAYVCCFVRSGQMGHHALMQLGESLKL